MICIITDYGTESVYVAELVGVIKSINPKAEIMILINNISRHNIFEGSFILKSIVNEFPQGSIFLVVVDPGVGTERKPIIVETKKHIYVGPDNGLFYGVAMEEGLRAIYEIDLDLLPSRKISKTFHGRDIFAVVAAILSISYKPQYISHKINDLMKLEIPKPNISEQGIEGTIIFADNFGNLVTNIHVKHLEEIGLIEKKRLKITFKDRNLSFNLPFKSTYAEVNEGEPLLLIDSFELLEIAINKGNAKEYFQSKPFEKILVTHE